MPFYCLCEAEILSPNKVSQQPQHTARLTMCAKKANTHYNLPRAPQNKHAIVKAGNSWALKSETSSRMGGEAWISQH